jgi:hypothetical protein
LKQSTGDLPPGRMLPVGRYDSAGAARLMQEDKSNGTATLFATRNGH